MVSSNERSSVGSGWGSTTVWRALICASCLLLAAPAFAIAETPVRFNIPAQPLPAALKDFAAQANVQLLYQYRVVRDETGNSLVGEFDRREGLQVLLHGTGLEPVFSSETAVTIRPARAATSAASSGIGDSAAVATPAPAGASGWLRLAQVTEPATDATRQAAVRTEAGAQRTVLEEVIVTARFRAERAQDIGQSIRAFGTQEIERSGIVDFEDIARRTPGLAFNDRGPNRNEASIRGISQLVNGAALDILPSQTVVRMFVDDIPVSSPNSSQRDFNLFDFNRVEVLRGPQPTYFGEGSVGGTIRYVSQDPDLAATGIGGKVALDVSQTDGGGVNYSANAAANFVLVPDKLGIRVVGFQRDDDGFIDNTLTGDDDYNSYQSTGGRIIVKAQPTEQFSLRLAVHLANDDMGGDWVADDESHDYESSGNAFQSATDIDEYRLYSLNLSYDFGPLTLTSVTGQYQRERRNRVFDFVQSRNTLPILFGLTGNVITENLADEENFTQELRLVSQFDGRFNFTAGAVYQDAEYVQSAEAHSAVLPPISVTGNDLFFGTLDIEPSTREHKSAFFELSFAATERLKLIGGLRWVDEEQRTPQGGTDPFLTVCVADADGAPPFGGIGNPCLATILINANTLLAGIGAAGITEIVNDVEGEILPKLAAEFRINDDVLLFASAAKGIRNGGVNSAFVLSAAEIDNSQLGFDQDELWAYELGVKSLLAGGDVLLNATVYHNVWSDIQVLLGTSAGSLFVNAPQAESDGIEIESLWRVTERLDLFANVGYIRAEFTEETILATAQAQAINDFFGIPSPIIREGNKLPNVPEWTYSAGLDWHFPLNARDLGFRARLDYQYIDERFTGATNNPATMLDSYGLGNIRIGLEGRTWTLTGYVSNVTNEIAAQALTRVGGGASAQTLFYLNRPRSFGLNFSKSFE